MNRHRTPRAHRRLIRAALVAAVVAGAAPATAPAAPAIAPAAPATAPAGDPDIACIRKIADDGRSVEGACFPEAPGTSWRFAATTCGPSSCRTARSSWYPQDRVLRTWAPGGFIADVWFEYA